MKLASKESGMSYALISGIQRIKLSGAEKRAFARWSNTYSKSAALLYDPPIFIKVNGFMSAILPPNKPPKNSFLKQICRQNDTI